MATDHLAFAVQVFGDERRRLVAAGLQVHDRARMVFGETHQAGFDEVAHSPARSAALAKPQRDPLQLTHVTSDAVLERNPGIALGRKTTAGHRVAFRQRRRSILLNGTFRGNSADESVLYTTLSFYYYGPTTRPTITRAPRSYRRPLQSQKHSCYLCYNHSSLSAVRFRCQHKQCDRPRILWYKTTTCGGLAVSK